jgi:hypothetical protein
MRHVVGDARKEIAQTHPGREVERVANRERMALDTRASRALVKQPARIAGELSMMSFAQQSEREAEDLGFAAGESALGIDAEDAQLPVGETRARSIARRKRIARRNQRIIHFGSWVQSAVGSQSIDEPVVNNRADCSDRVAPTDLLPLLVGAPGV